MLPLFRLPYADYFGGVTAMKREVYITINGFSNSYWGWGAEDDDLFNRVTYHKLPISRYYGEATRYTMLKHGPSPPNPKRYVIAYLIGKIDGNFFLVQVQSAAARETEVQPGWIE